MQINLKIEILKVFTLEFSFCSEKKGKKDEKTASNSGTDGKPS
jgi:hypothetical protein